MLHAESLSRTYRTPAGPVEALRGFEHVFEAGRTTAIVGPSGSGKSTLLNLLAGLDVPDAGRVLLEERAGGAPVGAPVDVGRLPERERARLRLHRFGIVFQASNLVQVLPALQNVAFPMGLAGVPRAERQARAAALLERFGVEHRARQLPFRLSGGERQRVALARALANDPDVLFADEPTGNLDSASGGVVLDALRRVAAEGRTVIVVTHDLALAGACDVVLTLRDGSLIERGEQGERPSAGPVAPPERSP